MVREWGALVLFTWAVAMAADASHAQTTKAVEEPWYYRCNNWTPLWSDKAGVHRVLFPIGFGHLMNATRPGQYRGKRGLFATSSPDLMVSLISEPDRRTPTRQFITPAGATIDFYPEGPRAAPTKVANGQFADDPSPPEVRSQPEKYALDCVKGRSASALDEPAEKSLADLVDPLNRSSVPQTEATLTELVKSAPGPSPRRTARR